MLTLAFLLIISAFLLTIASAIPRYNVPLWIAVLLLAIERLLSVVPR